MIITPDKVISTSGINMVKQIIMRHIELMAVCQSHSFEIFVSLSNLVRFYTYVVTNVFVGRKLYNYLTQDAVLHGKIVTTMDAGSSQDTAYISQAAMKMQVSDEEKDRVSAQLIF